MTRQQIKRRRKRARRPNAKGALESMLKTTHNQWFYPPRSSVELSSQLREEDLRRLREELEDLANQYESLSGVLPNPIRRPWWRGAAY